MDFDFSQLKPAPPKLADLNAMPLLEYVGALLSVYGNAAWIPALSFAQSPFTSLDHLHRVMTEIAATADPVTQEQLLRVQPDFLSERESAFVTPTERAAAAALELTRDEVKTLHKQQAEYQKKFDFPLIVCLVGPDAKPRSGLMASIASRLGNTREDERQVALGELSRISRVRLFEQIPE
ncbi:2-oxo-4-hydroxy-4-carboxy-5-ureidoimidazoline decarboxylase [Verrucomicrobium sp. GAS474]|uniref:2-oxo-4-hydroxy-4-carboxy-5-ureidoimidazoline decarboxylase n=1 Tax=Verrucomicrobium sp. GAS474 TaxID=1882831 RepID=UPI000879734C|nr:2-oxo-4-hydroxy-4-carboxy-5-ureidoimidazoline decarboxylase [Verrucomicrobium sp. GAS474]SDT97925.1 2-oxo-4-hydroxy-4-carboxy-5-ureidoimidazoline decarboxylase [Verrucomicrobium sp. GAS474]